MIQTEKLLSWLRESQDRTFQLTGELSEEQWVGPEMPMVNTPSWEVGHVAWFSENFALGMGFGCESMLAGSAELYDSSRVEHPKRWRLQVPDRASTNDYLRRVQAEIIARLEAGEVGPEQLHYVLYVLFHQDMHNEAFAFTQQTLAYPLAGELAKRSAAAVESAGQATCGDIHFPAGQMMLGAAPACGFVFDNEKWEHPIAYESFDLAPSAVTRGEFRAFVEAGGYAREELWSSAGWRWREEKQAEHPVYWRRSGPEWEERFFDSWQGLRESMPMIHVSWFEADAYCRWSQRRLPSEVEWECAAKNYCERMGLGEQPFWQQAPEETVANLDYALPSCQPAGVESGEHPAQLFGNVWEWTSSVFAPFDGFVRDCYRDYSFPWFHERKVLRGGAWATASRMLRPSYRNFYQPYRRDVFAGFRTCGLRS